MAASGDSASISEEEIDQLTMLKAKKLCRQHKISLEGTKELYKMKWDLKFWLLCQGKKREEAVVGLSTCGEHDKTRRKALSDLFDKTIEYAECLRDDKDPVIDELNKMFPNVCETLNEERIKMMNDVAPVLVLGEIGSGKSSFINLLLGENILPCSLLSNTHVICEIRYCGDRNNSRVKDLVQKVYRKALEEQKIYRPESAIFICNKWDEQNRADVWDDTKRKIYDVWPKCEESQILRFSTAEAIYIQDKGGMAPKFEVILNNINSLVPIGQEVLVLKGYRYIEQFISRCILCFGAHLSQLELSKEEREGKRKATKERLNQLKSRITSFFEEQTRKMKADIDIIADNLKKFINGKSNLEKVCKFSDSELPKRHTWNEAAVEVRHKVYGSMRSLIKKWEASETQFGSLAKDIEKNIEKEFPAFDKEIYEAEKNMSSCGRTSSKAAEETEIELVPEFIQNRIVSLSLGTKVALGIGLSPVLLVGMIIRLPVYGVQAFDKFYSRISFEKEFLEVAGNKEKLKKLCQRYAENTVASITDKMNMRQVIEEDMQPITVYMKQQQKRIEGQIQCDLDLLKNLKVEDRKDEDIKNVYKPISAKF